MAKKIKDELLDHDYDGIQELDNDLPPWWIYLFYFTIVWAVGYMLYFHVFSMGDLQEAEYLAEMEAANAIKSTQTVNSAPVVAYTDAENIDAGKGVYTMNCVPCHGTAGEGTIGPNMTDEYWINGGKFAEIVKTITVGVPAKGMIPWRGTLSPKQIIQVSSYIETLKGTNPPNAKAPEGEKEE